VTIKPTSWLLAAVLCIAVFPSQAGGQEPAAVPANLSLAGLRFDAGLQSAVPPQTDGRRCAGCPKRNLLRPYLITLAIDAFYNGINRFNERHDADKTAIVNPKTWWANLKAGFEWDDNPWMVNQFGHPYQGSDYFTVGRAHGLTFWESASVAAFGSATWEYFAESNRASLNDLINTTLGGITLGEVRHRTAWLIRDPTLEGSRRSKKEAIAAIIDPFGFLARWTSGDAKTVSVKPDYLIPSRVGFGGAAGVIWQGTSVRDAQSQHRGYIEMDLEYGDIRSGKSRTPYEAFTFNFASGSAQMTQSSIRGRLYSTTAKNHLQVSLFQTYDFNINRAYHFGGQGLEVELGASIRLTPTTTLWMAATGGANILGAVDTLIEAPPHDERPDRDYDYGPGGRIGGIIQLVRNRRRLVTLAYHGDQVSVVDGGRSNHVVQWLYLDARFPLGRTFAVGAVAENYFRKVYVFPLARHDESPQFRAFLSWERR
jgi:Domain of unknown function (DUF3943)